MRLVRPHCPPALCVGLCLLVLALASPASALAAFHRDTTPLDASVSGGSGSSEASSSGGGGAGAFARMLVGLVIVIAVILAVYWLLKTWNRSKGGPRDDGRIKVVATTALGQNRAVHLIEVGGELVLVGSAEHGVTPIRVYAADDARRLELEAAAGTFKPAAPAGGERGSLLEQLRRRTAR